MPVSAAIAIGVKTIAPGDTRVVLIIPPPTPSGEERAVLMVPTKAVQMADGLRDAAMRAMATVAGPAGVQ